MQFLDQVANAATQQIFDWLDELPLGEIFT